MKCEHILDMIDALPWADQPDSLLKKIQAHTAHCQSCQAALSAAQELDAQLALLSEPEPPANLSRVIQSHTALHARKQDAPTYEAPPVVVAKTGNRKLAWVFLVLGVLSAFGAQIWQLKNQGNFDPYTSPLLQITEDLNHILQGGPTTMILAGSLLLFITGFFGTTAGEKV